MELCMYRIVATSALWILHVVSTTYGFEKVVDQCCEYGVEWYSQSRGRCPVYPNPIRHVSPDDQMSCTSIISVCCLAERSRRQCDNGKQVCQRRGSCNSLYSQLSAHVSIECCQCCQLGLLARASDLPCTIPATFSQTCIGAFESCCSGEMISGTTVITTPLPTLIPPDEAEREDMCAINNPCEHECVDTGLSIMCRCNPGYVLQPDGSSCQDLDECIAGIHSCRPGHICVNTVGSYFCQRDVQGNPDSGPHTCPVGFGFNSLTQMCEDIDECVVHLHSCSSQNACVNTIGSFFCNEAAEGPDTEVLVDPTSRPTNPDTHHEIGTCDPGYIYSTLSNQCEDLDECATHTHSCFGAYQVCRNTVGSFSCLCEIGFMFNNLNQQCEDINECALNQATCLEGQQCENTIGSFSCRRTINCGTGYTLDRDSQQCVDNNECTHGTHNCGVAWQCRNTLGSFRCEPKECPMGYKLNYSTGSCDRVVCNRGLKPDRDGNCIDINECVERPNVCRANQECRNTIGSFVCRNLINCGPGFELNDAGTRCIDIDECSRGTHDCTGDLQECINRHGTYLCQCPDGYQMNHNIRQCEDIDECRRYGGQVCAQHAECENTPGSFNCRCHEGFTGGGEGGRACQDTNECLDPDLCEHSCRNTWGSYQCVCREGYQLAGDGHTCEDMDECSLWADRGGSLCVGICHNTPGSYSCSCPNGYRMMNDGRTCEDTDECRERTASCSGEDRLCINTRGGYECELVSCPSGFVKVPNLNSRNKNIHCQRRSFVCKPGDTECLTAPISYSLNFLTFPSHIRVPAVLFTMRGRLSVYRRAVFELEIVSARDPGTGETRVTGNMFRVKQERSRPHEAQIELLEQIDGPQDIELRLNMHLYSREFNNASDEFFGTAVARIKLFVTEDNWLTHK